MNKYVIHFSKEGYVKYTSHLDLLRLFKRAFKKSGIELCYSKGFNPHPKMGFAQPLSLGYTSRAEFLEFETKQSWNAEELRQRLEREMPAGVEIFSCTPFTAKVKSLAAATTEASYLVIFPVKADQERFQPVLSAYLAQSEIMAEKRQKKTKKLVSSDIRPKIREIRIAESENLALEMRLDCGSSSNLSPEQVIASFLQFAKLDIPRYDIEVERLKLVFDGVDI